MSLEELQVSEKILAGTQVTDESNIVPAGKLITVHIYTASCPDSPSAFSRLEYGSDIKWIVQREGKLIHRITFTSDGVSAVKVICFNGTSEDYYFNAYAKIGYE